MTTFLIRWVRNIIPLISLLLVGPLLAEEEAPPAEQENLPPVKYFQLSPNLQTFYQGTGNKFKYVVVQVQVVVRGDDNITLLEEHAPLMHDVLTIFFNSQDKSAIEDFGQRKSLQDQVTEKIKEAIKQEVGKDIVENVLFTQFLYQ